MPAEMKIFGIGLLSWIVWLPLVGALLLLLVPKTKENVFRYGATGWALFCFLVSLPLWTGYNKALSGIQYIEDVEWIPFIGSRYQMGVDGISIILILLTTVLGFIACYCSWTYIKIRNKEYYIFLLMLQTGMLGVFVSMDLFLFYVFWEVMLVPMYFLIGIWGSENRLYAAIKFFLYTLFGSVVMLLAILKLYFIFPGLVQQNQDMVMKWAETMSTGQNGIVNAPMLEMIKHAFAGGSSFNILAFQAIGHAIPLNLQIWMFAAFALGFAIKVPMFPFHTWLPDAHVEAPTAGSVILAGVLLKFGAYGFLRMNLPVFPDASIHPAVVKTMIILSVIGIVYGALVAMAQTDMKKLVAYSSVSHMGLIVLGIFAFNMNGLNGAVIQMVNHGISTSALFMLVGVLYERRHTRKIAEYGGLMNVTPGFAVVFLIMTLSSLGLPLLNGFIGEFLLLRGAFEASPLWGSHFWVACAALGIVLGAAYLLWLYQRVMFGEVTNEKNKNLPDLTPREWACFAPLIVLAVWIGVYPKPVIDFFDKPNALIAHQVRPAVYPSPLQIHEEEQRAAAAQAVPREAAALPAADIPNSARDNGNK